MNIADFTTKFAEQFAKTDPNMIKPETEFKQLEEWSSMLALLVIAMINEEYDVTLKGDDMRNSRTVEDLFNAVKAKSVS
jgi:acyl carrier protein